VIVYPDCIRNRSQWNAMWRDNQPHGYSRPILFRHSAKRVGDCGQNHHDCRQNIPWLLWNALLTTPYISEHYKYSICFWLLETCTKCSYFIEENIRPGAQRLAFEVRVYRTPATYIPWAGGLYLGKFPDNRRLMWYCVNLSLSHAYIYEETNLSLV